MIAADLFAGPGGWSTGAREVGIKTIRVRADVAAYQGFPSAYPWRGTRTRQFEQVGNAVPPPLAAASLRAVARP